MLLAEDGRAVAQIVISKSAKLVEEFAAGELQKYLGLITDCEFDLLRTGVAPTEPSIVVARADSDLGRSVATDVEPTRAESYVIAISDRQIALIGADDRGVLYAVYAFLEEDCGVIWLAPHAGHEAVPGRPTLELAAGTRSDGPAWPIRTLAPVTKTVLAFVIDWCGVEAT